MNDSDKRLVDELFAKFAMVDGANDEQTKELVDISIATVKREIKAALEELKAENGCRYIAICQPINEAIAKLESEGE